MPALIECVPNFSEGRNPEVMRHITAAIESVEGAALLHVDAGKATNRTVVTLAGEPGPVVEAAFRAIKTAQRTDRHAASLRRPSPDGGDRCLPPGADLRHNYGRNR